MRNTSLCGPKTDERRLSFGLTLSAICLSREYLMNSLMLDSTAMSRGMEEAFPPSFTHSWAEAGRKWK